MSPTRTKYFRIPVSNPGKMSYKMSCIWQNSHWEDQAARKRNDHPSSCAKAKKMTPLAFNTHGCLLMGLLFFFSSSSFLLLTSLLLLLGNRIMPAFKAMFQLPIYLSLLSRDPTPSHTRKSSTVQTSAHSLFTIQRATSGPSHQSPASP